MNIVFFLFVLKKRREKERERERKKRERERKGKEKEKMEKHLPFLLLGALILLYKSWIAFLVFVSLIGFLVWNGKKKTNENKGKKNDKNTTRDLSLSETTQQPKTSPKEEKEREERARAKSVRFAKPGQDQKEIIQKKLKQRGMVVRELFETERSYVANLQIVVQIFLNPLKEEKILSDSEIKLIFSYITIFLPYHEIILSDFLKHPGIRKKEENREEKTVEKGEEMEDGSGVPVGEIFCRLGDFLKNYPAYVNEFSSSLQTLETKKKTDKKFAQFLKKTQKNKTLGGLDLGSFLILPVQRIPRYVLLLQEVLKCTPGDHPDYNNLYDAVEKIRKIADIVNENKRKAEQYKEVFSLTEQIQKIPPTLQLLQPNRIFLQSTNCALSMITMDEKTDIAPSLSSLSPSNLFPESIYLCNDLILLSANDPQSSEPTQSSVYCLHLNLVDVLALRQTKFLNHFDLSLFSERRGEGRKSKRGSSSSRSSKRESIAKILNSVLDDDGSSKEEKEEHLEKNPLHRQTLLIAEKTTLLTLTFESERVSDEWFVAIENQINHFKDLEKAKEKAREKQRQDRLRKIREHFSEMRNSIIQTTKPEH